MNEKDAKTVQDKYVHLGENLEALNISSYLYQEGVLSYDNKEQISALSTSKQRNEKLLDILMKRADGLKMLIKAVMVANEGVQKCLGYELLGCVSWSKEEKELFRLQLEGKINQQQMLEMDIAALKAEIQQLKENVIKSLVQRLNNMEKELVAFMEREKQQQRTKRNNEVVKTNIQEEEAEQASHQLRARRNAISFKEGSGSYLLHQKSENLEIASLKAKNQGTANRSLREVERSGKMTQEYHHELRARRNAISYGIYGRISYLAELKGRHKRRQSVRHN